jgi:hypothetical protein
MHQLPIEHSTHPKRFWEFFLFGYHFVFSEFNQFYRDQLGFFVVMFYH